MNWIMNLRTRSKLFLGFGVIIVFLGTVIFAASDAITLLQKSQKRFFEEDYFVSHGLLLARSHLNRQRVDIFQMIAFKDPVERSKAKEDMLEMTKITASFLDEAIEKMRGNPVLGQRLVEAKKDFNAFVEARNTRVIPLIEQGKTVEAERQIQGVQHQIYMKIRNTLDEIGEIIETRVRENLQASKASVDASVRMFTLIGILALFMAVAMAMFLERSIANPLRAISGAAETIASGDFTVQLTPHVRRDEIGVLSRTFKTMLENLRAVTQQIKEGASVLAASSSEILAATTQVASSATETATAVSQTTATVEEVKQTAQLSNQKAKHVSESAKKAVEISQSGRKAVEESIDGMTQIRKQMESIGESIMKLSEQSQAIGEIIASVGDLAEQSNLLSVNAAIEAAKAGEQGKGFAVVAQEVKALAEQSKQATAQVRTILGEIQKATSTVVLSAEQGSKAVEAGMKQVTQSGESIRALAESVADAAQAATQIAASSQQQFVGVDQVASAMESIKQASTQNVAGTKQVETAAQNLTRLGSKLQQLVEQFRV